MQIFCSMWMSAFAILNLIFSTWPRAAGTMALKSFQNSSWKGHVVADWIKQNDWPVIKSLHLWLFSLDSVKILVTVNEPADYTIGLAVMQFATGFFLFFGFYLQLWGRGVLKMTVSKITQISYRRVSVPHIPLQSQWIVYEILTKLQLLKLFCNYIWENFVFYLQLYEYWFLRAHAICDRQQDHF